MIDLRTRGLPNAIVVDGKPFLVKTDFREWLKYEKLIEEDCLVKDLYYLFVDEIPDSISLVNELNRFFVNANSTPKCNSDSMIKSFDYIEDGEYIVSSFMQAYSIDLTSIEYMHWHMFKALFAGLPNDTIMKEIISMRSYRKSSRSIESESIRLRDMWSLEQRRDSEREELIDSINSEFYNS